jgi:hypothetical protein
VFVVFVVAVVVVVVVVVVFFHVIIVIITLSTQGQTDSVPFYLSNVFGIIYHSLFLCKLRNFGLFPSYVKCFPSYVANRDASVRI